VIARVESLALQTVTRPPAAFSSLSRRWRVEASVAITDKRRSRSGQTNGARTASLAAMNKPLDTQTLKAPTSCPMGREDHLALFLNTELEGMRDRWLQLSETTQPAPIWSWEQIGEALLELTGNPVEELIMRGALSGLVKQAAFKPQDLVLAEILRLAIAARDHGFGVAAREMLEAEMT